MPRLATRKGPAGPFSLSGGARGEPGGWPIIPGMSPMLAAALAEAAPFVASRGWVAPGEATIAAAQRLLDLVAALPRAPAVQAEPDGRVSFEWEAGDYGWLTLAVDDTGKLTHNAVLGEDEFTQAEDFGATLPDWAAELLGRVMRAGH